MATLKVAGLINNHKKIAVMYHKSCKTFCHSVGIALFKMKLVQKIKAVFEILMGLILMFCRDLWKSVSHFSHFTSCVKIKVRSLRYFSTAKRKVKMEKLKSRENPVITKLDTLEFKSIFTPELEVLISLFKKHNHEIRIAGGAVRDLLLGKQPKDLDFATPATPQQMIEMFTSEDIRLINPNGAKHGTITPRINEKENFEVTTLRIDVATDGRHADIEYTKDWMLDANRRDLTINSMFLGLDGSVYDYFYGYDDILKKRIAFVGDADKRIKEDYLRILRYFRFYGKIAEKPDSHDENTLRIISQNVSGLERISHERIWSELKKILQCHFAGELLKTMHHVGVTKYCGFPEQPDMEEMAQVWARSKHLNLHPVTLLASLLRNEEQIMVLNDKINMSIYDKNLALFIVEHRDKIPDRKPLLPYQKMFVFTKKKKLDTKEWIIECLKYKNSPLLEQFKAWNLPMFPVTGKMLKDQGMKPSREMGDVMNELRKYWVDHEFEPDAKELLGQVPKILSDIEDRKSK